MAKNGARASTPNRPTKINQGVLMVFRLNAAICGAVMTFAFSSVAMAQNEVVAAGSNAVVIAASRAAIVGAASTYNPYRPGWREGGAYTASGERYDSSAWTAAVKTNLRKEFGGVLYGASPKYALVEGEGKKAIVKINDVGPLTPGRIIDFNERTMRYFDPSLQRGVIDGVRVTPLSGEDWTPGPVTQVRLVMATRNMPPEL
jgi:rare lipoprotein A